MSINNVIDKQNSVQKGLNKVLVQKRGRIVRQITNVVMSFAIAFLIGVMDIWSFNLDWSALLTAQYWLRVLCKTISFILATQIGINWNWDIAVELSDTLQQNKKDYSKLSKYRDENFDEFVEIQINRETKKDAYKANINGKISKLDKHTSPLIKACYVKSEADVCKYLDKKEMKKFIKFKHKKDSLKEIINEDYLEENIDMVNQAYERVDASSFSVDITGKSSYSAYKTNSNVGGATAKYMTQGLLIMVMMGCLTAGIVPDLTGASVQRAMICAFTIVMDLIFIVTKIYNGARQATKMVEEELALPYGNRNRILNEYIAYNKRIGWEYSPVVKERTGEVDNETIDRVINKLKEKQ